MDNKYRRRFNQAFSSELYDAYCDELARRLGCTFEFRLAETPVFLPQDLRERCIRAAQEIVDQLSDRSRLERMKKAVPPEWDTPGLDELPTFAQVDLAIVRDSHGSLVPRLIELQGFPSLAGFQVIQRDVWAETLQNIAGLDRNWSCWFSGLGREDFIDLARRTIAGDHDPEHVILMDIDPPTQKTFPHQAHLQPRRVR